MTSEGEHEGRDLGSVSSDLAAELRRIILELDADQYPEEQSAQAESKKQDDEMRSESAGLPAMIHSLKRNLEDASVESVVAIRLLHELVRLRHTDLLNHLVRMEQNLQDEINLMERRVRGDIAVLRTELGIRATTDLDERSDDASASE